MESIVMLMQLTIWVIIGIMVSLVFVYIWIVTKGSRHSSMNVNENTNLNDNFSDDGLYNEENDDGPIQHL